MIDVPLAPVRTPAINLSMMLCCMTPDVSLLPHRLGSPPSF
jgi:hypothetical protein